VWDHEFTGSARVIATYVVYLRRKLAGSGPNVIHTQHAIGYCLRLPRAEGDGAA
jgi:two-component system, OmpR family, response regulator